MDPAETAVNRRAPACCQQLWFLPRCADGTPLWNVCIPIRSKRSVDSESAEFSIKVGPTDAQAEAAGGLNGPRTQVMWASPLTEEGIHDPKTTMACPSRWWSCWYYTPGEHCPDVCQSPQQRPGELNVSITELRTYRTLIRPFLHAENAPPTSHFTPAECC
ncbi:jg12816 [Pararge aegeria aegeria]|uniref:Jg12816 protein n=1 Tax=Pararge aegeria aegeria TaxID=348720 RepID=A0A8S4RMV9_9NEOP|nr:jg12816 [Pararge aegeria aegeria]